MEAEGLLKFLKPYQVALMKYVWSKEKDVGVDSGESHRYIQSLEDENLRKSRASVIFFYNDMVKEGILRFVEKTGKGGHHRVYYPHANVPCEESFKQEMAMRMVKVAGDLIGVIFMVKQKRVEE